MSGAGRTVAGRLRHWLGSGAAPGEDGRWVVVDVETSGLDTRRDRLLAIAAIGLRQYEDRLAVALGDSFEVVLRQSDAAPPDKPNILLHGIGVGAQRSGMPPARALQDFERWLAGAPLVGFHSAFDAAMIDRALAAEQRPPLAAAWLDLEPLAAVLLPAVAARLKGRSLDDWMGHFGIECLQRHAAAADTLATAELLLRLWPLAWQQGGRSFRALQKLAAQRRWLAG